jgi:hypothetical protein
MRAQGLWVRREVNGSCGILRAPVSEIEIFVPTRRTSMSEARTELDAALASLFPGGLIKSHWEGETMHLTGPGAAATLNLEPNRFVGRGDLQPPASFMQETIVEKVTEALRRVAVGQDDA